MTLCACTSAPAVLPLPPQLVEVDKVIPRPAECDVLQPVDLPSGSSARDVLTAQHEALRKYENQVEACAKRVTP